MYFNMILEGLIGLAFSFVSFPWDFLSGKESRLSKGEMIWFKRVEKGCLGLGGMGLKS